MGHETLEPASASSIGTATALPDDPIPTRAAPIDLSPNGRRPGWRTAGRITFIATSWLLVAGLVVQIFLAGLGVFDSPERFEVHSTFGFTLQVLPLIMLLSGLAGGLGRRLVGLAGLTFGLFFLQSLFIGLRGQAPMIAALHPLNGFLILFVSIAVARGSLTRGRPGTPAREPVG
jgi:hypothetical protein